MCQKHHKVNLLFMAQGKFFLFLVPGLPLQLIAWFLLLLCALFLD